MPNVSYCAQENKVHYNPYDPYNGHEYVDLGLPSGLLWAKCNVGATSETEYGGYYLYGGGGNDYRQYSSIYTATTETLPMELDTARLLMGGEWRMPTKTEAEELISKCDYDFVTINGVLGCKLTSKENGNYIFLPAAGNYSRDSRRIINVGKYVFVLTSTSELNNGIRKYSYYIGGYNDEWGAQCYVKDDLNGYGYSVRGVIKV